MQKEVDVLLLSGSHILLQTYGPYESGKRQQQTKTIGAHAGHRI